MIKRFINKLLGKPAAGVRPSFGKRVEVPASVHKINPKLVDERAVNVVLTLKKAGFEAYIVGGAVRDLILGLKPKDFDVATTATPEQVKSLFRRAFIIGRRFRIVHVVYGRGREHEVIEVSTFRAYLDASAAEQVNGNEKTSRRALEGVQHAVDASGRVLRDNVWGPQEEDAARRDFTLNAMYYDPEREIVVDYHKGMQDAQKRTIRMIGDAAARYREDPVRIIRAVRFAAKLNKLEFKLDKATASPLQECLPLLADVPQSRLFDEMLKLLQTGHAVATIDQLRALGLNKGIYPLLTLAVERADDPFVRSSLQDTDRRVGEGKPVAPSFLLASLLWQDVRDTWARKTAKGKPPFVGLQESIDEVFEARIGDVSGRGKLAADMREIWMMQPRFEKRTGNSPFSLIAQLRFRAGFDFLRLRAANGEIDEALAEWWQAFSTAPDYERDDLIAQAREQQREAQRAQQRKGAPTKPTGRVHRVPSAASQVAEADEAMVDEVSAAEGEAAPAKKRRRRRKPKSAGAGEAALLTGAQDGALVGDGEIESASPVRARKATSSVSEQADSTQSGAESADEGDAAAKRRRPRRRKRAGEAASDTGAADE